MIRVLPPPRWRRIGQNPSPALLQFLLCSDQPNPEANLRIIRDGRYQPDAFSLADRMAEPAFLSEDERDFDSWLEATIERRMRTVPITYCSRRVAVAHVRDEFTHLTTLYSDGKLLADVLLNQEILYILDRMIAWALLDSPWADLEHHSELNRLGHSFVADLFRAEGEALPAMDSESLLITAISAGLIGLDIKGGEPPSAAIPIADYDSHPDSVRIWDRLASHARLPLAIDQVSSFLDAASSGPVLLIWFLDDLIETAFDLLVVQRLLMDNRMLRVLVVPKKGVHDNDASAEDVAQFLRLRALRDLAGAVSDGRAPVHRRGPRMGTAHPLKLDTSLVDEIVRADLLFVKGGRVQELFMGNVNRTIFTGCVVVREFTESETGIDSGGAPAAVFGAEPGEWPWWGFRGRSERRLTLPRGRRVPACHSTVAEHVWRTSTRDGAALVRDLADLLGRWQYIGPEYHRLAVQEVKIIMQRLGQLGGALAPKDRVVLEAADRAVRLSKLPVQVGRREGP